MLGWLNAELSAWTRVSTIVEPANKALVAKTLNNWNQDANLAGVRDQQELAKLPEAQRQAWKALWGDVTALLKQVTKPGS